MSEAPPPKDEPGKKPLGEKARRKALAGLVSRQIQGVAKDWAGLLNLSVSYDPPKALEDVKKAVSDLPAQVTYTELEVEGDIQGKFLVLMRIEDAFAFCAGLLGRKEAPPAENVLLDAEMLDALKELFNLFCGGTDKALRKGAEDKLHVKQISTRAEGREAVDGAVGSSPGLGVHVSLTIGDRKGVSLWEFFPADLADALVASHGVPQDVVGGGVAAADTPAKGLVLVVDDQYALRTLSKRHLEKAHYKVVLAESGEQALHACKKEHIDAVLLDVMMPQMDGIEVCRRIRALPPEKNGKVPIIMCTGKGQRQDVMDAIQAGANDYIVKPFTREILIEKVEKVLPKKTPA